MIPCSTLESQNHPLACRYVVSPPKSCSQSKNLGATCYANASLQVWFRDIAFRRGVYLCKPQEDEQQKFKDSPIFQLQVTFAALQESTQSVFNPAKLVESLQLRAAEQQDAQEYGQPLVYLPVLTHAQVFEAIHVPS